MTKTNEKKTLGWTVGSSMEHALEAIREQGNGVLVDGVVKCKLGNGQVLRFEPIKGALVGNAIGIIKRIGDGPEEVRWNLTFREA